MHGMQNTLLRSLALITALFSVMWTGCRAPNPHSDQGAKSSPQSASRYELFVLGAAQDGGMPHLGCNKICCQTARAAGRVETPACLGIHDRETGGLVLIEATPGVESQVAALHAYSEVGDRARRPVDAVMLTHAHIGHYLGLAHFGREVASTKGLPVFVSPRMAGFLRGHGPWKQLVEMGQIVLREVQPGKAFEVLPGLRVTATAVPHRDEFSDTMAFTIHGPQRTVLFVPDIDSWKKAPGMLEKLVEGVDIAYLDATFYDGRELPGRNIAEIPHPPMIDSMRRLEAEARATPGRFRFIHLNHSNPAWYDADLRADILRRGFRIAATGERVAL